MDGISVIEFEPRDVLRHVLIKTHRSGFSFAMIDGSHDDEAIYTFRDDVENAAIKYIANCRSELFGTGTLLV